MSGNGPTWAFPPTWRRVGDRCRITRNAALVCQARGANHPGVKFERLELERRSVEAEKASIIVCILSVLVAHRSAALPPGEVLGALVWREFAGSAGGRRSALDARVLVRTARPFLVETAGSWPPSDRYYVAPWAARGWSIELNRATVLGMCRRCNLCPQSVKSELRKRALGAWGSGETRADTVIACRRCFAGTGPRRWEAALSAVWCDPSVAPVRMGRRNGPSQPDAVRHSPPPEPVQDC